MTQVIVTFDIIEYLPSDFKFDNFSFIISSEARDFEQEISYLNKNQITHKATLNKRELKYSIKTTKNSSLIGISDLTIPSSVLSKRENIYDKTCSINMSDSVRRVIFGNTSSSNSLKINIHITLQYKEKEKNKFNEKKEKDKDKEHNHNLSTTGKKIKPYERSESFGKGGEQKKESGAASNTFSQRNFAANKKNANIRKVRSNSKPASSMKNSQTMKPKTQIFNNNNKLKEVQKAILDDEQNEEEKKNKNKSKSKDSFIDEELNKEIKEINPQFINFMKDFNNKNPLDKLNSISDVNEMLEYTKNIVDQLLDYQLKYYDMYNKVFLTKNKLKKLLVQNNEKLRMVKKQINKLDEENDLYEIKEILNHKNNNNNIKDLLPLKESELDTYKELYGLYLDKSPDTNIKENKEEIEKNKKLEEKKKNEEKTQNLLIKVLTHSVNKYGPVNKLFTQTNSTEPERINIRKLATKYNLPINAENEEEQKKDINNESNENKKEEAKKDNNNDNTGVNEEKKEEKENKEEKVSENNNNVDLKQNIFDGKITKWEYVSTEKPDKIDKKLEQYLKYFYSKRTFPKILFKKTSTNNYEYGTQKVMVKIEGDTIRIRYIGGYLLIDKFIEMNAANEEKKVKKQNEKNTGAGGIKKKDSSSIKKK